MPSIQSTISISCIFVGSSRVHPREFQSCCHALPKHQSEWRPYQGSRRLRSKGHGHEREMCREMQHHEARGP